jgi:signal transduction histidine kinase
VSEEEKAKLARDIHDELGGILVSAKMDVESVQRGLAARDPSAAERLARAMAVLDSGVDVKRRIIEELRPTLLDNFGLPTALDWLVTEGCKRAGLDCNLDLPEAWRFLRAIDRVYRIVQSSQTHPLRRRSEFGRAPARRRFDDPVVSDDYRHYRGRDELRHGIGNASAWRRRRVLDPRPVQAR